MSFSEYKTTAGDLENDREARKEDAKGMLPFGIPYLDQALGGVLPGDIVLLGARSGAGKTETATLIAESMIRAGKKVGFLSLESQPREITRRRIYRRLSKRYFSDPDRMKTDCPISFLDWMSCRLDAAFGKYYEDEAAKMIKEDGERLLIRYRGNKEFTMNDLERSFASMKNCDCICIDHFHYFDLDPGPEVEQQKRLAKTILAISQEYRIPIILVAHLRKTDNRNQSIIPTMEEFSGTSELFKIPTKVVLLASGGSVPAVAGADPMWITYVNIDKCRADGSRARYKAKTLFNIATTSYEEYFSLGNINKKNEWESLPLEEYPRWARPKAMTVQKQKFTQVSPHIKQIVKDD